MDFSFLQQRKKILLILAAILLILMTLLGGRMYFEHLAEQSTPDNDTNLVVEFLQNMNNAHDSEPIITISDRVSPLTGLPLLSDVEIKPISVMVENYTASRPQMRGLNEAGIVYEVPAEGGITRFLAIFDTSEKKRVGPVRSARPYFIEWAEEFGGAYVHAGGSQAAMQMLRTSILQDFDEDGDVVYRDFQYLKPHNLFVNLKDVRKADFTGKLNDEETWFDFSGEIPDLATDVKNFSLDFSFPEYLVKYNYDSVTGLYQRLLGGSPHMANGDVIQPRNIIVQFTEYYPIDDEGRLELQTTGEDIAWYFSGGKMWKGVWKKSSGRTQFYDNAGKLVKLQPGQTFIEILDSTMRVKLPEEPVATNIEANDLYTPTTAKQV